MDTLKKEIAKVLKARFTDVELDYMWQRFTESDWLHVLELTKDEARNAQQDTDQLSNTGALA